MCGGSLNQSDEFRLFNSGIFLCPYSKQHVLYLNALPWCRLQPPHYNYLKKKKTTTKIVSSEVSVSDG